MKIYAAFQGSIFIQFPPIYETNIDLWFSLEIPQGNGSGSATRTRQPLPTDPEAESWPVRS